MAFITRVPRIRLVGWRITGIVVMCRIIWMIVDTRLWCCTGWRRVICRVVWRIFTRRIFSCG